MKTFSVKSKFVIVLALVLALFGGALLLFFGQSQKMVIRDAVAVDGPTNQEGFWTDEGRRASGFSGGTGYEDSPYQISSAEELAFLAYQVNEMGQTYAGRYFVLTDNIDLSQYYWQPIGPFAGNFDGATYYIEGLYTPAVPDGVTDSTALSGYSNQGLFGYVNLNLTGDDYLCIIKNITIQNSFVQGYENVGAVVGRVGGSYSNYINNYIQNCTVAADVNVMGDSYVGGVTGQVSYRSAVEGCVNNGQITASSGNVGGISGGSYGSISDCVNNGTITQNEGDSIGGIVGRLSDGADISNCTNNGQIIAKGSASAGGILGSGQSSPTYTVKDCVNNGQITASSGNVGGVAGTGSVLSSYNTGNITNGEGYTGGVCGMGNSSNSYNSGSITGGTYIGGISNSLLSYPDYITVANSYNSGDLFANENTQYVGGVVGGIRSDTNGNMSQVRNSFNTGTINAENATAGGIIGVLDNVYGYYSDANYVMAVNSFNVGQINGGSAVYGVVGASNVDVSNPEIWIENIYYNNTDGQGAPLAAVPSTSTILGEGTYLSSLATQAKTESFFTNTENWSFVNRWDFVVTWAINPEVNDGYPSFNQGSVIYWTDDSIRANSFGGGSGTQEDPYLISNAQQLAYLAYMVNSGQGPYVESVELGGGYFKNFYQGVYFKQTQPIDLSTHIWPGIGVYDVDRFYLFAGNYDGGGFEITGMYAVGEFVAGLFRVVGNDPLPAMAPGTPGHEELSPITIENIVLVEPTVSAIEFDGGSFSGGIIGALYYAVDVTVQNCSVQGGFVVSADGSGGIVGMMGAMQSKIVNCQNSANVVGGGIVGGSGTMDDVNVNFVLNCVNSGQVYGAGIILQGNGVNLINCINNGTVERLSQGYDGGFAAGIAGSLDSNSSVIGCVNNGQISGSATYAGGLVGELVDAQIINSYNTGDLNVSAQYAGGLVGYSGYTGNRDTVNSIARSYNIGSVTNTKNISSTTAGILAYSYKRTNISNCYNKGNITSLSENASSYTAGIIAVGTVSDDGQYKNIYNTGTVTANSNIGGIIGCTRDNYDYCDLDNAFNTGNVVYNGSSDSAYIGGVAANAVDATDVANAYYGGACPSSVPAFGSGSGTNVSYLDNLDSLAKTEEWFATASNWNSSSQWDFANTWAITEGENDGYPVLIELDWWINSENVATSFAGGSGTQDDPYLIETPAQLAYLSFAVYYGLGPTQAIRNYTVTFIDTYFKQTANIDLSGHLWLPIGTESGAYGEVSSRFFGGNYDGGGFYITGMTFASWTASNGVVLGYPYGIFGYLAGGSSEQSMQVIENIVIGNPEAEFTIQAPGYVGGVVGVTGRNVIIRNCTNYANITATMDAEGYGGIVGYPQGGNIIDCTNYGTITGCNNTGGIAGGNAPYGSDIEIANSYNYGNIVSNGNYVGGIAGQAAIVSDCINYATVSGAEDVGGVVGYGTANTSANHGDVSGQSNVGGVLGYGRSKLSYDCYNTGSVTGQTGVGGVAGALSGSLYRSYSTGAVSGTENVGGVIGSISSSGEIDITNTFAIGSISGTTNVGGVVGRSQGNDSVSVIGSTNHYGGSIPSSIPFIGDSTETNDAYMADLDEKAKQQSFFEDYDVWNGLYIWDFAKVWTFKTGENDGYPVFSDVQTWIDAGIRGTSFGGGSGTKDDPYIISSAEELAYLSYMIYTSQAPYTTENVSIFPLPFFYQNTYFKQTADIDLSAYYWSPIGASSNATTTAIGNIFAGHYDGGGYTISGLKTLNGPSLEYANQALFGLFGSANSSASISNVILENTDITGRMTVAGLVGTVINSDAGNTATISNCHHYGNLYLGNYEAANNVGGIVGINFDVAGNLVLENYSNAGNIDVANEQANAGGVVGNWTGNLSATNIQSFASISGGQNVGAFAGALNLSAYLSADKTVTVETALLTGTLSGTNVGGFAGSIETQTTATTNTVTVSRVGYEVDIISATTASVIAPLISGSNISFTNSYAIIDASQTSISQFTTQAEGMTQDSSLYYVETASGENRYYAGNDFSDFVWVDDSPCPIMADFVWMGEDLLRIYYETYGEGYMTNLITSSGSGWQAIA